MPKNWPMAWLQGNSTCSGWRLAVPALPQAVSMRRARRRAVRYCYLAPMTHRFPDGTQKGEDQSGHHRLSHKNCRPGFGPRHALAQVITELRARGYSLVTLDALTG
jgi:peptidoglycan/xylan/chitin deacetylase (PgdA/CDA1 family)